MIHDIELLSSLKYEPCEDLSDWIDIWLWDSATPPNAETSAQILAILRERHYKCDELIEELEDYMSNFAANSEGSTIS